MKRRFSRPVTNLSRFAAAAALVLAIAGCSSVGPARQERLPLLSELDDGQRIDRSVRVAPGVYTIEDLDNDGALTVVADDVTLDLTGVVLVGAADTLPADEFHGIAIRAEGVSRLRIIGGTVRGFRVAIEIIGGTGHTIERSDLSGNFRQRLRSTPDVEVGSDWLWPHQNDEDEWTKRYGTAIHFKSVADSWIRKVTVRRGQNGIVLSRCRGISVRENDASYLSGWGLALWRTTDCEVTDNRFDFCVRGYSHGVYARGQDSSGILVFEQSSRNTFRKNLATHGGDGFFLFAGNETLKKTGTGGSNDNLIVENDFSHAVANAVEATFSRGNRIEGNRLEGSNYGVWAGYSFETVIAANAIGANSIAGVAIEHGTGNLILDNHFRANPVGVSLWWDDDRSFAVSAFGKARSTESEGNLIARNHFEGDRIAIELRDARSTAVGTNHYVRVSEPVARSGRGDVISDGPAPPPSALSPPAPRTPVTAGRSQIFIDEWGPYDGEGVRAWPATLDGVSRGRVHLLGPGLPYRIDAISGAIEVSERTGKLPTTVEVTPRDGTTGVIPFAFVALTEGNEITVRGTLLVIPWQVEYRRWDDAGAHEPPPDWRAVRASSPLVTELRSDLDLQIGSGAPAAGVPADHFATIATSTFTVPPGRYRVTVVSDDGVRVRLDGKTILDDWTWHPPRTETIEVELDGSPHRLEVDHFEIDGHAVLGVTLAPLGGDS